MYNSTEFYTYPCWGAIRQGKRKLQEGGKRINRHLSVYPQIIKQIVDKTGKDVQRNLLTEA